MNQVLTVVISILGGTFGGAFFSSHLSRRNTRLAESDRLLTAALDDAFSAISEVGAASRARNQTVEEGVANRAALRSAQARYGSAVSRIALHGSPEVVDAFVAFQREADTTTEEGRRRLVKATNEARNSLGRSTVDTDSLAVLHFGPGGV